MTGQLSTQRTASDFFPVPLVCQSRYQCVLRVDETSSQVVWRCVRGDRDHIRAAHRCRQAAA